MRGSTVRNKLTPQMDAYAVNFADNGDIRWLPYLMYFHPTNYRSSVVNTDASGFRYSESGDIPYSVADHKEMQSARLLVGSSTVFGIGASSDRWTLSSCLSKNDRRGVPWLNFGGRSFNSTQELILFTLYRHLLPKIEEIVLFSGFNNLGLARQPVQNRMEHGAFFNCNQFFDAFRPEWAGRRKGWSLLGRGDAVESVELPPSLNAQIDYATDLTLRHLDAWRALAADLGAKLTYVLQPLAGWVRPTGCVEEEALFEELERVGRFSDVYGDILTREAGEAYAAVLQRGANKLGVKFVHLTPLIAEALKPEQWLFVDRIHFTDQGHDFVSKLILDVI